MSGSKQKLSAEERKQKTLNRVAEEFAENGFEGTRIADLAEAAGISEAMLVKLYGSKDGLYRALIRRKIEQTDGTPFPDEADAPDGARDRLLSLARNLVERCDEDPTFFRLLYYSALEDNELSDMFYEKRIRKLRSELASYFQQRIEDGAFRVMDPEVAAVGFMGMVCHVMSMKHIFSFPLPGSPEEGVLETFVDLFLDGCRS